MRATKVQPTGPGLRRRRRRTSRPSSGLGQNASEGTGQSTAAWFAECLTPYENQETGGLGEGLGCAKVYIYTGVAVGGVLLWLMLS